jgi:hypothetical protein
MRIGITGHQRLRNPIDVEWVKREIETLLRSVTEPFVGITSLATGVDQLFAAAVLHNGGSLEAIIPHPKHERSLKKKDRTSYRRLRDRAAKICILASKESIEQCYLEAGRTVVDSSDLIIAVWNGKLAAGSAGTANIVKYARQKQKKTVHINPDLHTVICHTGM